MSSPSFRKLPTILYIVFFLQLAIFLVASFFPAHRIWGVNWWAYLPSYIPVMLFVPALILALLPCRFFDKDADSTPHAPPTGIGEIKYFSLALVLFLVFGLSFILFKAETHFLGDGYTLLNLLSSDTPLVKPSNFGETLFRVWTKSLIGGEPERAALLSYQIISIASGILLMLVVIITSKHLFQDLQKRLLFVAAVFSGGYMLLFFGYVEHYSVFALAIGIYTCLGMLVALGKLSKWLVLPSIAFAIFLHIFGVFLLPSALYLLFSDVPLARRMGQYRTKTKLLVLTGLIGVLLIPAVSLYRTNFQFRLALTPLITDRFTIEGYTLISANHLFDYLNLLLVLAPALPLLIAGLYYVPLKKLLRRKEFRFLALLILLTCGASFFVDPKLGMPRDWDLLSLPAIPIIFFTFYAHLTYHTNFPIKKFTLLAIFIGYLALFPRVYSQADPEIAIKHIKNYFELDVIKNRNGRIALIHYYEDMGDSASARFEGRERSRIFPETIINQQAKALFDQGRHADVIALSKKAIELNPTHHESYANIGISYLKLKQNDSALTYLDIANGLNHNNRTILANLGTAYIRAGKYNRAEKCLKKALEIDPERIGPLVSLATMYLNTDRVDEAFACYEELASRDNPPLDYLKILADGFLKRRAYEEARRAYEIAYRKGLDPEYVKRKLSQIPQSR